MDERREPRDASGEEALLDGYLELQEDLEKLGVLPMPRRNWLARRKLLEWLGAVQVAFVVACFSVFLIFFLFNFIFHIGS